VLTRYTQTLKQLCIAWEGLNNIPLYEPDRTRPVPLELRLNYMILMNPKKPIMAPKASLSKKATLTQEEYEI